MSANFKTLSILTITASVLLISACVSTSQIESPTPQAAAAQPPVSNSSPAADNVQAQLPVLPKVDTTAAQLIVSSPDEKLEVLDFPVVGTKAISGHIKGRKSTVYALPVGKGQNLVVSMETSSKVAYFNIDIAKACGSQPAFAGQTANTNTIMLHAVEDATYVIRPFLVKASAKRGKQADYTLNIIRQ